MIAESRAALSTIGVVVSNVKSKRGAIIVMNVGVAVMVGAPVEGTEDG